MACMGLVILKAAICEYMISLLSLFMFIFKRQTMIPLAGRTKIWSSLLFMALWHNKYQYQLKLGVSHSISSPVTHMETSQDTAHWPASLTSLLTPHSSHSISSHHNLQRTLISLESLNRVTKSQRTELMNLHQLGDCINTLRECCLPDLSSTTGLTSDTGRTVQLYCTPVHRRLRRDKVQF